jgi:UDP-N-acetylglucosamine 4-epimerase
MRDFCYVQNVVQANLLAATTASEAALNQVYNVALGGGTTLNELFESMRAGLERHFPHLRHLRPAYRDFAPGDIRLSRADIGRARERLGYEPQWSVAAGLRATMDWYVARESRASRPAAAGLAAELEQM